MLSIAPVGVALPEGKSRPSSRRSKPFPAGGAGGAGLGMCGVDSAAGCGGGREGVGWRWMHGRLHVDLHGRTPKQMRACEDSRESLNRKEQSRTERNMETRRNKKRKNDLHKGDQ
eukprot:1162097-Pelagomonas_calceolata.AAC.7